jgi:hypothetical protein
MCNFCYTVKFPPFQIFTNLTLLWYHEKSYVNSNQNNSTVYYFPPLQIIFYNRGLYSNINKQTRLCLGTFEYIEADREIYRKYITNPNNIPQHFMCEFLIILHTLSLSVGICLSLYVMLWKKKKIIYITWKVHLTPSKNKHK